MFRNFQKVENLNSENDREWSDLDHDLIVAHFQKSWKKKDSDRIWLIILTKDRDLIWLSEKKIVQYSGHSQHEKYHESFIKLSILFWSHRHIQSILT